MSDEEDKGNEEEETDSEGEEEKEEGETEEGERPRKAVPVKDDPVSDSFSDEETARERKEAFEPIKEEEIEPTAVDQLEKEAAELEAELRKKLKDAKKSPAKKIRTRKTSPKRKGKKASRPRKKKPVKRTKKIISRKKARPVGSHKSVSRKSVSRKKQGKKKPNKGAGKFPPKRKTVTTRGVEASYASEKAKAERELRQLEKERLRHHLDVLGKKQGILLLKEQKLVALEKEVDAQLTKMHRRLDGLHRRKERVRDHYTTQTMLKKSVQRMEQHLKKLVNRRKKTLRKEEGVVAQLNRFYQKNAALLKKHGLKSEAPIRRSLKEKMHILADAAVLAEGAAEQVFSDYTVLDAITQRQLRQLKKLNTALKAANEQNRKLQVKRKGLRKDDRALHTAVSRIEHQQKRLEKQLHTLSRTVAARNKK